MTHIACHDRSQTLLLPETLDDYVDAENPVRFSVGDSYDCEFMVLPGEPDPSLRLTPCHCIDLSARRAAPADPRNVAS